MLSRTLLGHLAVPSDWMELNIGGNWWQKYHIFLQASAFCIPLHPQYLQVGEHHGRDIIGIILPSKWSGMDEPVKDSKNSINSHHKHMARRHLIEIEQFIHDHKCVCAIFYLSKKFHRTFNFMHRKSQLSVSELYFYRYLNI